MAYRHRLSWSVAFLACVAISTPVRSAPVPVSDHPAGAAFAFWFAHLFGIYDAVFGEDVTEIQYPAAVQLTSPGYVSTVAGVKVTDGGPATEHVARCVKRVGLSPGSCAEPGSFVQYDVDDPSLCTSGNCYIQSLDAGSSPDGTAPRTAIVHANVFPPQNNKVVTADASGVPEIVVESGDPIPSGGGATFSAIGQWVATAGPWVAFSGSGGGISGVYLYDADTNLHSRVVDNSMARPRAPGNFSVADSLALNFDGLQFLIAWSDDAGVYVTAADLMDPIEQPVADGDEYAPGLNIASSYGGLSFWKGTDRIAFDAIGEPFARGGYSVSRSNPGAIVRHADAGTSIPGGGGNFVQVQRLSGAGSTLFFEGFGPSGFLGVYADRDLAHGAVEPALLVGDQVQTPEGARTVDSVSVNPGSALSPGLAAFLVYWDEAAGGAMVTASDLAMNGFETGDFSGWSDRFPPP